MGLQTLEIFYFFQCAERLYTSEFDVYMYVRFWRIKTVPALKGLRQKRTAGIEVFMLFSL